MDKEQIIQQLNMKLNELMNQNRNRLIELREKQQDNHFLSVIVEDYKKYYNYTRDLKQQQARQIEQLILYLEKSLLEVGLTETTLEQARYQKRELMRNLDKVRREMDELMI